MLRNPLITNMIQNTRNIRLSGYKKGERRVYIIMRLCTIVNLYVKDLVIKETYRTFCNVIPVSEPLLLVNGTNVDFDRL